MMNQIFLLVSLPYKQEEHLKQIWGRILQILICGASVVLSYDSNRDEW